MTHTQRFAKDNGAGFPWNHDFMIDDNNLTYTRKQCRDFIEEVRTWCLENLPNHGPDRPAIPWRWEIRNGMVFVMDHTDAMMFKMRWC